MPDLSKIPLGKVGEVNDNGEFFADPPEPGIDEPDDDDSDESAGEPAKAPANAGTTRKTKATPEPTDEDTEEEEDSSEDTSASATDDSEEGEQPDGESAGEGTDTAGDGADEDDGADPAVSLSIRRNWESRFDGEAGKKAADPLAMVSSAPVEISDTLKRSVKAKFEAEDDIGAIQEVVQAIVPQILKAYDDSRITPVITEHQANLRNARIVNNIADFDQKHPGVRVGKVNERMAAIYDEMKTKYGYQHADQIPVEDYFYMAGGSLRKRGGSKAVVNTPKTPSKADEAEAQKNAALAATRQPERVGKPKGTGSTGKPNKKRDEEKAVGEFVDHLRSTRFDPFVIR